MRKGKEDKRSPIAQAQLRAEGFDSLPFDKYPPRRKREAVSVSDNSADGAGYDPNPDWKRIRYEYETRQPPIAQRALAKEKNVSPSTLMQRAMREKWSGRARIVKKAAQRLEANVNEQLVVASMTELAPYLEQKKVEITKRGVRFSEKGLARIQRLWRQSPPDDARDEANSAKAVETFVRVGRVSLGMSDGSAPGGAIQLNILTNRSAVQVVSPVS